MSRAAKQVGGRARSSPSDFSDPITRVIFLPVEVALGRTAEKEGTGEMVLQEKEKANAVLFYILCMRRGKRWCNLPRRWFPQLEIFN